MYVKQLIFFFLYIFRFSVVVRLWKVGMKYGLRYVVLLDGFFVSIFAEDDADDANDDNVITSQDATKLEKVVLLPFIYLHCC